MDDIFLLYVEDDPTSRLVMMTLFERVLGCPYTIFENSEDFIERVETLPHTPTLFLLDIHMQPIDGFTMLRQLREHARYSDALIIALTASVMNEEVILLKRAGFDGGISKPVDQNTFPRLIERILNGEKIWHIV